MDSFTSTADMYEQMGTKQKWERQNTAYGFTLIPPSDFGAGYSSVWGNLETHYFIMSEVEFFVPLIERYYFKQKGIKISMIETMTASYYKEKNHIRLQPENSSMDPIIVPDCKILGKVGGVFRKI